MLIEKRNRSNLKEPKFVKKKKKNSAKIFGIGPLMRNISISAGC
jgi:hypothetical protein